MPVCQSDLDRVTPIITALGAAALATTPILVAIAAGLFDVKAKQIVVEGSSHRRMKILLILLLLVALVWVVASGITATNQIACSVMAPLYVGFAMVQVVGLLIAIVLLALIVLKLNDLVRKGNQNV